MLELEGSEMHFPRSQGSCAELDLFPTPLLGEAFERNNDSPAPLGNLPSL